MSGSISELIQNASFWHTNSSIPPSIVDLKIFLSTNDGPIGNFPRAELIIALLEEIRRRANLLQSGDMISEKWSAVIDMVAHLDLSDGEQVASAAAGAAADVVEQVASAAAEVAADVVEQVASAAAEVAADVVEQVASAAAGAAADVVEQAVEAVMTGQAAGVPLAIMKSRFWCC
jgi:hypothetical protein